MKRLTHCNLRWAAIDVHSFTHSTIPDSVQYTYLLTSQLESQRLFFEEKIARVEQESQEEVCVCVYLVTCPCLCQVRRLELRCRSTATEAEKLSEQLIDREKELKALEKRTTQVKGQAVDN